MKSAAKNNDANYALKMFNMRVKLCSGCKLYMYDLPISLQCVAATEPWKYH